MVKRYALRRPGCRPRADEARFRDWSIRIDERRHPYFPRMGQSTGKLGLVADYFLPRPLDVATAEESRLKRGPGAIGTPST